MVASRALPRPLNKLRTVWWMAFYNLIAVPFLFVLFQLIAALLGRTRAGAKIKLGRQGRAHLFARLAQQMAAFPAGSPRFRVSGALSELVTRNS